MKWGNDVTLITLISMNFRFFHPHADTGDGSKVTLQCNSLIWNLGGMAI